MTAQRGTSGAVPCGSLGLMNKVLHSLGLGLSVLIAGLLGLGMGGVRGIWNTLDWGDPKTFNHLAGTQGLCLGEGPKIFSEVRGLPMAGEPVHD